MDKQQRGYRRRALRLIILSSLVFFIALGAAMYLSRALPRQRLQRLETALSSGDTVTARRIIRRMDETEASAYLMQCNYIDGSAKLSAGDLSGARELFAQAGNYSDALEMVKYIDYETASRLASEQNWQEAAELFAGLGGYGDAPDKLLECRYELASSLYASGELAEAASVYDSLGDYKDSVERLGHIATEITGISSVEGALTAYRGLSTEDMEHMLFLSSVRDSLPRCIIDLGFYHTVGLGRDGAVLACGNNDYGQCDVSGLKNAIAVAAGAYHTLALHADGSVSALGRNSEHQCDVSGWHDVTFIAASDYASFGITRDGTLLSTGYSGYDDAKSWSSLVEITGGSYNLAAIRSDGTVWTCPAIDGASELRGAVALAINSGYALAAANDGTVSSTAFELPDWRDIVSLSASSTAVLGIDSSGHVRAHFFRAGDAIDFSSVENAVAVAAGGTHYAFVLSDGSVQVFGESADGQADTGSWHLAVD